eukprot:9125429-Alexandrium_andersonii.AAC.1
MKWTQKRLRYDAGIARAREAGWNPGVYKALSRALAKSGPLYGHLVAILTGAGFSEARVNSVFGEEAGECPPPCSCGHVEGGTWDHIMWRCPRYAHLRELDRPEDNLAARVGWPSYPEGTGFHKAQLRQIVARARQMATIRQAHVQG